MDRRLRMVVPAVPLIVFVLVLLLIEDPKKPWSGIAYVSGLLTVVAVGWAVGHWLIVVVPWAIFAVAFAVALPLSDEAESSGACDPGCWSGGAVEGVGLLSFVVGSLLTIGAALRWLENRITARRAR